MTQRSGDEVRSVVKAHDVLERLREHDGAGVTEIAAGLDMGKSTVYKYLSTLRNQGYVAKDGDSYHLGLKYLDFGMHARNNHRVVPLARPSLENLVEQTGEIGWCTCEENGELVTLDIAVGEQDINQKFRGQIGNRVYLHAHAGGKAILAKYDDDRVADIIDTHGIPEYTDETITDREELFDELDRIRDRGVAFNDEEAIKGYRAVGAGITQHGDVLGSITIGGPRSRLDGKEFTEYIPELIRGAINEIELRGSVETPWK